MALPRQIDKAAGQAAGRFAAEAANEAKMMANMQAARSSDIVKEASKGGGISGMLGSVWGMATSMPALLAMQFLPGMFGKIASKTPAKISGALQKTAAVINLANAPMQTQEIEQVVDGVTKKVVTKGFQESVSDIFDKDGKEHVVTRGVKRIGKYAQETLENKSWGRTALENMKGQQVTNIVPNAGWAVQGTASIALSMRDKVRTLKQMQKDLTGKDVSALSIVMGNSSLHPLVAEARKETASGKAIASTGMQLAGVVGNIYLALFNKAQGWKGMAKAMGIGMGTGMAANMLSSGDTAIQSYHDMTLSMAQTGKADVSLYEGLIGGLAQKAPGELVRQIAEKAYVKQMAPAEVLKMMAETDFLKNPKSRSFVATEMARRNAAGKGGAALAGA